VNQFWKEIRRCVRVLLRRPGFLSVRVLTLPLSIGANTAIFTAVNAILLWHLPYRHASRIVWITGVRPVRSDAPFSLPDFLDYRGHVGSLDSLSAVGSWSGSPFSQEGIPEAEYRIVSSMYLNVMNSARATQIERGWSVTSTKT
jgi:putative ABC transport system permease protein